MERIGEGLQYKVYEISGSRVRKVPKTREEMMEYVMGWKDSREEAEKAVEKAWKRRKNSVRILMEKDIDFSLLGNPVFESNGEVLQDRVSPVGEVFEEADLEERKEVVDQYVDLLQRLWEQGIGDTIYNFTINTGLTEDGELVMLDFGELVFSKERVRKEVEQQKWLEKWSYKEDMSEELKPYFKKRMDEEITVENLKDRWEKSV